MVFLIFINIIPVLLLPEYMKKSQQTCISWNPFPKSSFGIGFPSKGSNVSWNGSVGKGLFSAENPLVSRDSRSAEYSEWDQNPLYSYQYVSTPPSPCPAV